MNEWILIIGIPIAFWGFWAWVTYQTQEQRREAKKNRERCERVCNYDKNIFVAQDQAEKRIKQDERLR